MQKLLQQKLTLSGLKGNRSQYGLITPPPADHISSSPEMVGRQYGWVKIISPEKRWTKTWNRYRMLTQCINCGAIQWTIISNLTRGLSKGCRGCSQPRKIPKWLDRRLTAAKQRCTNPNDVGYENYGARGIQFKFSSVSEAGLWIVNNLGLPDRSLDLDRIDSNGHYEAGNLRWVTRKANTGNRRITVLSEWNQAEWPYARSVVIRKLSAGMTREEIIADAIKAVEMKRKNWRIIQARLDFMDYSMSESTTILPYRSSL